MLQEDIDFLKEIYALLKTNSYHDKEQAITMLGDEIAHLEEAAQQSVQSDEACQHTNKERVFGGSWKCSDCGKWL